jgi:hypothetical protein
MAGRMTFRMQSDFQPAVGQLQNAELSYLSNTLSQFLFTRKHTASPLQRSVVFVETAATHSENQMTPTINVCKQSATLFNVKEYGTHNYHCLLK